MAVARNVEIIITIDDKGSAQIRRLRKTTQTESAKMKAAAQKNFTAMQASLTRNLNGMTTRFLTFAKLGVAIFGTIAAAAVIKFGSSFEKTMSGVRAVTSATGRQMEIMTEQARHLGATTVFTAVQAAEAMEELGKAGFTTAEIYGVMPDVLNLAAAGTLEMAEAAAIASDVIRIMGLDITEFKDATDIMVKTAISAKTTVQELGFAYQDAAPLARALGITFKDLNVLMATLANRGFVATRSGTALRRIFSVFLGDLEEGEKGLAAYNVQLQRNDDGTVNLIETFQQLSDAGLDANAVMEAFGLRGGPAALNIISSLGIEVDGLTEKLNDFAGTAGQVAQTRLDNLAGDGKILLSTMQELALVFFDQVGPGLRVIAQGATEVFREWQSLVKASDVVAGLSTLFNLAKTAAKVYAVVIGVGLVTALAGFVVSAGTMIGSILTLDAALLTSIPIIVAFTKATIAAQIAMGGVGIAVGIMAVVIAGAVLKMTGLGASFDTAAGRAERAAEKTLTLAKAIEAVRTEIKLIEEVTPKDGLLVDVVGDLGDELQALEDAAADLTEKSEMFIQLRNQFQAERSSGVDFQGGGFQKLLKEAKAFAQQALNDQKTVNAASAEILRKEIEKITSFVNSATDEQKAAFMSAYDEAWFVAATRSDQIAAAFEIMAERTKTAAAATAEALRVTTEASKELARATKVIEGVFEAAGKATTEMGDALATEVLTALEDVKLTGKDTDVVIEAFGAQVIEMIDAIERAGERVPTALLKIGTAALELNLIRQQIEEPIGAGIDPNTPEDPDDFAPVEQPPDDFNVDTADIIEPPDPEPWIEFWDTIQERGTEFLDTLADGFANMVQGAITGFSNVVGAIATGQVSIAEGFKTLFKGLIRQAIGFLVQWAIQRFIVGKLIQKQGAKESAQALSAGIALTGVNTMASVSLAPWPISLSAPIQAAIHMAIAAGMAGLAAVGTVAGAGAEGGIIKRRSFIEVGEGSQEEAIIPLRGGHADRVRRELFRGQDMGTTVTIQNTFTGDNWRDGGIDQDLSEAILESIDQLINRGRDFSLATETRA